MNKSECSSLLPLLLIFYIAESKYGFSTNPTFAAWHALGFAAFLITLYLTANKLMPTTRFNSWPVISAFAALTCFHAGYYELLPYVLGPWLFCALLVTLAFLPMTIWNNKSIKSSYTAFVILGLAIIVIEYIKMIIMLAVSAELIEMNALSGSTFVVSVFDTIFVDQSSVPPLITYCCAILSIWTLFIFQHNFFTKTNKDLGYLLLFAAHILMILVLYQTTGISSLAVTASWLVYATIVIMFAFSHRDKLLANSALLVLGLAAVKALIYDASSTPTDVRIFCLLSTGIVLYFSGYLFRKIGNWKD